MSDQQDRYRQAMAEGLRRARKQEEEQRAIGRCIAEVRRYTGARLARYSYCRNRATGEDGLCTTHRKAAERRKP